MHPHTMHREKEQCMCGRGNLLTKKALVEKERLQLWQTQQRKRGNRQFSGSVPLLRKQCDLQTFHLSPYGYLIIVASGSLNQLSCLKSNLSSISTRATLGSVSASET